MTKRVLDEKLHRYLDGELPAEALSEELREEVGVWEAFLTEVRTVGPSSAPAGLESRVVRAVLSASPAQGWKRVLAWWVDPRPIRLSPLAALATAAVMVVVSLQLPVGRGRVSPVAREPVVPEGESPVAGQSVPPNGAANTEAAAGSNVPSIYVQFLLRAPAARSVSVAGDFTGWTPRVTLADVDGDGTWTALVPLTPGVHEYMFIVDGLKWVTDPYAERYADDGFGNQNAVLAIAPPQTSGL